MGRLIENRFGIQLSVWTVGRYLAQWGFTPQKPARRAFERDPERVCRWLDEEYPAIRSRAKREGAEHTKRIELFRLPSYSPDLNPDEMLNQDVKSNAVGRRRTGSQAELFSGVRGFLRGRQR